MEIFRAETTPRTPYLNLNPTTGVFEMKGKSIPENSVGYYKPMFEWFAQYIENPAPTTKLYIHLDYFNTSSSKIIVDLFKKLEQLHKSGKSQAEIVWVYSEDDEDMQEAGEDYKSILKLPFTIQTNNT